MAMWQWGLNDYFTCSEKRAWDGTIEVFAFGCSIVDSWCLHLHWRLGDVLSSGLVVLDVLSGGLVA